MRKEICYYWETEAEQFWPTELQRVFAPLDKFTPELSDRMEATDITRSYYRLLSGGFAKSDLDALETYVGIVHHRVEQAIKENSAEPDASLLHSAICTMVNAVDCLSIWFQP